MNEAAWCDVGGGGDNDDDDHTDAIFSVRRRRSGGGVDGGRVAEHSGASVPVGGGGGERTRRRVIAHSVRRQRVWICVPARSAAKCLITRRSVCRGVQCVVPCSSRSVATAGTRHYRVARLRQFLFFYYSLSYGAAYTSSSDRAAIRLCGEHRCTVCVFVHAARTRRDDECTFWARSSRRICARSKSSSTTPLESHPFKTFWLAISSFRRIRGNGSRSITTIGGQPNRLRSYLGRRCRVQRLP